MDAARRLILGLAGVAEGRSYGLPSFLLNGRFLARFRDRDTVLVLQLASMFDRDFLLQRDSRAFFFTDHYRNYPAVLIRLEEISGSLLTEVITAAWSDLAARPPARKRAPQKRKG